MRNKPVQVRPWKLSDAEYVIDKNAKMWARRTVFIGGLPRPTRARKDLLNGPLGIVAYR